MGLFSKKRLSDLRVSLSLAEIKKRSKILLIDDEPETFPLEMLRKEGYTIEHWPEVDNLERLEAGEFDIIILDISGVAKKWSQHEDGLAILDHLKKVNPGQVLVAFSGQTFDLTKQRFFNLADDVLSKPVDAVKCKEVIDELLRGRVTPLQIWKSIEVILRAERVEEAAIRKVEEAVVGAIETKDAGPAIGKLEAVAKGVARFSLVASMISKLVGLF